MRQLHMTLKKEWFDLIASGEKKEEYRELKQYWIERLYDVVELNDQRTPIVPKQFDVVIFKNGYSKDAPTLIVEWKGTDFRPDYTSPLGTMDTIVVMLGEVIERKNIKD